MDDIGNSHRETILEQNVVILLSSRKQLTALPNDLIPVDIVDTDVTPMDNSNQKGRRFKD